LASVDGSVLLRLTPTSMKLETLDQHQRLIDHKKNCTRHGPMRRRQLGLQATHPTSEIWENQPSSPRPTGAGRYQQDSSLRPIQDAARRRVSTTRRRRMSRKPLAMGQQGPADGANKGIRATRSTQTQT
jgi:hypothetical protein